MSDRWRDRPYLSWSRIRSYSTCSLQYFFRYVSKEKPAFIPAPLAFGIGLHTAVENALKATVAGTEFTIDDLVEIFSATLDQQDRAAPIKWPAKQDRASAIELAKRMLIAWLSVPKTGRIISIEEPVSLMLPSGMRLIGRVDFVLEEDDHVAIGDIKTAAKAWTAEEIWKGSDQLVIYREALKTKLKTMGKPIKLGWQVVTKTKEPRVQKIELTDAPATAERAIRIASEVERGIEAERFFPQPGLACLSCPFREPCRRWGTVSPSLMSEDETPDLDQETLDEEECTR